MIALMERRLRTMLDDAESSTSIDCYGKPMATASSVPFSTIMETTVPYFSFGPMLAAVS